MYRNPDYLFFKQSAALRSYFGEICLDVPRPAMSAVVFSEMRENPIGNVRFVTGPGYDRGSFPKRMISWIKYVIAAVGFSLRVSGRPLVFIIAQPPFLTILGYLHKKLCGRHYVVWVDDVYPDVLVRRGLISSSGWIARTWRALNRVTFGYADHVFTLSPHMLATVQQYLPAGFPATIVPTWVDTDIIHPVPKPENVWAEQHGFRGKTIVMYSGNFGETHDVDTLLEAARQLKTRRDLAFVLIGAGAKWEAIRRSASSSDETNVHVLPWQPSQVLPQSLSSADIAYVSLDEDIDGISMPSKTYYAMAAGAAILASCATGSDLAQIVSRHACGAVVKPRCVSELVHAIEDLCEHSAKLAKCKANARAAAVDRFSRKVNAKILREILEEIVSRKSRYVPEQLLTLDPHNRLESDPTPAREAQ